MELLGRRTGGRNRATVSRGLDFSDDFSKATSPLICRVQQASKVELFIDLKTAKTLGLDVPLGHLQQLADE